MAIDTNSVGQQVLTAIEGVLAPVGQSGSAVARQVSADLATALGQIEISKLAGEITEAQAEAFVDAASNAAMAALEGQLGIAELTARNAVKTGLGVLLNVALGAAGLGWAGPIIQNAADKL